MHQLNCNIDIGMFFIRYMGQNTIINAMKASSIEKEEETLLR
jgi:hypothetical protein